LAAARVEEGTMTAERWAEVRNVLYEALDLPAEERSAFLNHACSGDDSLRKEVESLLTADEKASSSEPAQFSSIASVRLASGTQIDDYQIEALLGSGGMGEVYRARDLRLNKKVAIKVLPASLSADPQWLRRFEREARAAAALNHPNIMAVYRLGTHQGVPYLVSELLEGQTLREELRKGPLPLRKAIDYGLQVTRGLAAAHHLGIIHRDLKPENLFITRDGCAKILDFGLAKLLQPAESESSAGGETESTQSGLVVGTPGYMSPEQVRGLPLDTRSDIFALGALLYEMLSGKRAFEGETRADMWDAVLNQEPRGLYQLVPGLAPGLELIVNRCLAKDPEERFQSVSDVAFALEASTDAPGRLRVVPALWLRRLPGASSLWASTAAVLASLFVVGFGYSFYASKQASFFAPSSGAVGSTVRVRPALAVLGFKNLAGRPDVEWLSMALSEMLTTELAAGEKLRTISGENVARAKIDLALPEADSYAGDTLARIRKSLGTDYVVLGSYLDLGQAGGGQVRLDLRLQDAREGTTLTAVSETGNESSLFDLVARAGKDLRDKLGAGEVTAEQASIARASTLSNPEAARLYAEGLAKLRSFDALGARDLLQESMSIEPGFPLTHAALSEVWRILGDLDRTREGSWKAFEASKELSRGDRLSIEARYREASLQSDRAIQAYRALFTLAPDNLDYGLALARAQWSSGKPEDAMATLDELKALPAPARDDPRIDLEESGAATEARNSEKALAASARAVRKARDRGSKLLLARALRAEAEALLNLGKIDEAKRALSDAQQAAHAVGDNDSAAYASFALGKLRLQQEDLSEARAALEEAQRIWRKNGDRTYAALTSMLLGIVSGAEGNLHQAQNACEQALAVSRELGDKTTYARMLLFLGDVLAVEGNLPQAHQRYSQAAAIMAELGSKTYENRSDLALAQLSIAEHHPVEAEAAARRVLEDPHVLAAPDFKLASNMVLTEALLAQGKTAEAQQVLAGVPASRNTPMLAAGINFGLGQGLPILAERVRASTGKPIDVAEATRRLQVILDDSAKRGNLVRQFQARLALGEVKAKWGDKAAARDHLTKLEQDAAARGFGLIARQCKALRNDINVRAPDRAPKVSCGSSTMSTEKHVVSTEYSGGRLYRKDRLRREEVEQRRRHG
jgi:serine/threonine protein kinase/tetratricopeptide (TPR) repeat protein